MREITTGGTWHRRCNLRRAMMRSSLVLSALLAAVSFTGCATDDHSDKPFETEFDEGETFGQPTAWGQDLYPSQADCDAAKERGDIPPMATCRNEILFCPDGKVSEYIGDVVSTGTYAIFDKRVDMLLPFDYRLVGTLHDDGTLITRQFDSSFGTVWQRIEASTVKEAVCP
jgi:hypothetical protein